MTFLKKLGTVILRIIGISNAVLPIIEQAAPQSAPIADRLTQAFNVVVTTEQMFTAAFGPDAKKGSDKLKAATPFVAALVQQIDLVAGRKPKDETLFADASTRLTSALADILNSFGD